MQLMTFANVVRARLGVALSVSQVFTNPTISAIAAVLDGDSDTASQLRAPVIAFRTGGTDTPVVLLPPGTGLGWRYGQLLAHIPERRAVYAIQSPQISDVAVDGAVSRAVDYFADQVHAAVPDGPVVLAGWSFGGSLAPAVAAELAARNRQVESLVLLDAFAQSPAEYFAYIDSTSPHAAAVGALDVVVPDELRSELTREQAIELVLAGDSVFSGLDPEIVAAVLDSSAWSLRVMRDLTTPTNAVSIPVAYLEAEPAGSLATWADTITPSAHLSVPWVHSAILSPDAVAVWGPWLAEFLQE